MKKWLVYLIVFFSLFYFIDIVKATDYVAMSVDSKDITNYLFYDYDSQTDEIKEKINNAKEYFNVDTNIYDYIIIYQYGYLDCYSWKKVNNLTVPPSLNFLDYRGNKSKIWLTFYLKSNESNSIFKKSYKLSDDTTNSSKITSVNGLNLISYDEIDNKLNYLSTNGKIFESSIDIIFNDVAIYDFNSSAYNPIRITPITICNEDLCYQFYQGDILIKANGDLNIGPVIPEISFESINKYDDNELIKINFSIFDTDKYLYFYRTSNDNEYTWIEINQNDYYYQSYTNCNLYVIAIDKEKYVESAENGQELVYDIVSSSTYTFSQLNETIPELSINTTIPDSCYLTVSDKENIICKSLTINILNNYSTEKYLWEYSKDNVNFIPIFTDSLTNIYSENITLYFRLLDKQKNEYIKYSSYKLYGITITSSELGPYIKLTGRYDKEKILYEITAYFYNKDFDNYNYFYTIDENNWTQIQESQLNVYSGSIYNKIFNIYNNCTFIIKIEDKNGNYVNSFTFTVDFDKYFNDTLPVNKISSFLNNTSEEIKTISELIQYFYDGLDSRIQDFLIAIYTIILICSIIVLARS